MDINKLTKGNAIKYNNRYGTIMAQLSYNEYLINHCGKPTTVNILDIQPIELGDNEWKNLGFEKRGRRTDLETEETAEVWAKDVEVRLNEEVLFEQTMEIDVYDDVPPLSLEDITGIKHFVPEKYTYVHQVQNLLSYVTNDMPEYVN
jgi:hypothetical protein